MTAAPQLGPYQILGEIGSGGMGVVYRARDERLQREVALKVFALDGAGGRRDRARLLEEARAASSLQHPNIVAVYDVGEADSDLGTNPPELRRIGWIAMERVDGQTLEHMIVEGNLPLRRSLEVLVPIAEALARAHAAGIVHRDVKPGNIMVGRDGRPRILDFGLARRTGYGSGGDASRAATLAPPTLDGLVVGTAAFMSPEQAAGEPVDFRSDIFSFGTTLYRTVSGKRPFRGASDVDVMHAILHDDPIPIRSIVPEVPESLAWVVEKCLHKERDDRYQSTLDLVIDLKRVLAEATRSRPTVATSVQRSRPARRVPLSRAVAAAALALALGLLASLLLRPAAAPGYRLEPIAISTGAAWAQGAPSPSGASVALASNLRGNYDIYLVAPGADPVARTDSPDDEIDPAWSPDGATLVYTRETSDANEVWSVPAVGGIPRRVLTEASGASFTPDGRTIVYVRSRLGTAEAIGIAGADGGNARIVAEKKGWRLSSPRVSPDGRTIAFVGTPLVQSEVNVWTVPMSGGEPRPLTRENNPFAHGVGTNGCDFTRDGEAVLYTSNRAGTANVWAAPLSGGAPRRITSGIGPDVYPRAAPDGSFITQVYRERWSIWGADLSQGLAVSGSPRLLTVDEGAWAPALSPDGTKLAYCTYPHEEKRHVYVADLATRARVRISTSGPRNANPTFSPDGKSVVWFGDSAGTYDLWTAPAEGGPATRLTSDAGQETRPYFFPDGKRIVFACAKPGKKSGVCVLDLATGAIAPIAPEGFFEPRPSPDGKWVVAAGDREGGENHGVWVFPADGSIAPRRVAERGYRPLFAPGGKEVVYLTTDPGVCRVWAAGVEGGTPRRIHEIPTYRNFLQVDISADGRLLAFNTIDAESSVWRWVPER